MKRALCAICLVMAVLSAPVARTHGEETTVGWRGDGTGRFPEADPPLKWERISTTMKALRTQAAKPRGEGPGEAKPIRYGSIEDWLVLYPVPAEGTRKELLEKELLPGEADFQPDVGDKVGDLEWKPLHVEGSALYFNRILPDVKTLKDQAVYTHAYVWSPRAVHVLMRVKGSQQRQSFRLWVNGEEPTVETATYGKGFGLRVWRVPLKAGWNRILARSLSVNKIYYSRVRHPAGQSLFQLELYGDEADETYEESGILWTVALPEAGNYSSYQPVIVGDRIYVAASPAFLVCYDKLTGRRRWVRYNGFEEFITPEERAANPELFAEIDPKAKRFKELAESYDDGDEQHWEMVKLHAALTRLLLKVDPKKYAYPSGPGRGIQEPGLASQPVSDGKFIYTWSYLGIAACYDLDGNRKWMTLENEGPQPKHGYELAPILIGDDLACETKHWLGFDRKTGKLKWKVPGKPSVYHHNGKPLPKGEGTDIINYDGLGLYKPGLGFFPTSHTTRDGDTLWRIDHGGQLGDRSTLPDVLTEAPKIKERRVNGWHMPGDPICIPAGYFGAVLAQANPLFDDGLVYTITLAGVLRVQEKEILNHLYARIVPLNPITYAYPYPHGSGVCASPTLAGKYIYLFGPNGLTLIIKPGREYRPVAMNRIERLLPGRLAGVRPNPPRDPVLDRYPECTVSSPVFDGKRMYYRAERFLYCIGSK